MARAYATFRIEVGLGGSYRDVVLADTPYAYWPFNEIRGASTIEDAGDNGLYGAVVGGVTLGELGTIPEGGMAGAFDGSSGKVTLPSLAITSAFSVEAWIKTTSTAQRPILSNRGGTFGDPGQFYFGIQSGKLFLYINEALSPSLSSARSINDGRWHHVVATSDGTTSRLYIDGVLDAAQTQAHSSRTAANYISWDLPNATEFFPGSIDEVAVYRSQVSANRIAAHYAAASWTELTDVLTETGIYAVRGSQSTGPIDRLADPGTLEFSVRNDKGNSGRTRSWYSPNHPNARSGWTEGIPVRLVGRFLSVDYPLWRGRIRTIDPTPGDSPQRAAVVAHDVIADLTEADVREIPPQIDRSETELLTAVFNALPIEARPAAIDFDASLDIYSFAFDGIGKGQKAIGLINDVIVSAVGTGFVAGDGTFIYRNRHSEATADSVLTLQDEDLLVEGPGFSGASSLSNVFNRFRVTVHPKDPIAAVLFSSSVVTPIAPGQTVELFDAYSDPDNRARLIGGKDFITPVVATTDYLGNAQADGLGANLTSLLTVTVEPFASNAKTTISHTHTNTVYVTFRQLRGTGIFDNAPATLESFVPQPYGDRPQSVDLKFQDDPITAQDLADYFSAQYSDRTRQGDELVFDPQRSAALMQAALSLELGDVATASERQTGLSMVDFLVRGITYDIQPGPFGYFLRMRLRVVPKVTATIFTIDDVQNGLLDGDAVLGYA
jgi:hypothetical protein